MLESRNHYIRCKCTINTDSASVVSAVFLHLSQLRNSGLKEMSQFPTRNYDSVAAFMCILLINTTLSWMHWLHRRFDLRVISSLTFAHFWLVELCGVKYTTKVYAICLTCQLSFSTFDNFLEVWCLATIFTKAYLLKKLRAKKIAFYKPADGAVFYTLGFKNILKNRCVYCNNLQM